MKYLFLSLLTMSAMAACQVEADDVRDEDEVIAEATSEITDATTQALAPCRGNNCMYTDIRYSGSAHRWVSGVDKECLNTDGTRLGDRTSSIHNYSGRLCHYYKDCGYQNFLFSLSAGESSDWLGNLGANDMISSFRCN